MKLLLAFAAAMFTCVAFGTATCYAAPVFAITTENPTTYLATAASGSGLSLVLIGGDTDILDTAGTPWDSSSTISEFPATVGGTDSIQVDWEITHLLGPHAADVNPGPQVIMNSLMIPTAAGPFTMINGPFVVTHPDTEPDLLHQDTFTLTITGTASLIVLPVPPFLTRLVITSYTVTYSATHTVVVPEPSTLVLSTVALVGMIGCSYRRRRRT